MFIRATIRNRNGETFTVKVENKCNILIPRSTKENFIFYSRCGELLAKFGWKIRKYCTSDYTIDCIVTDVPFLREKLSESGFKTEFLVEESELVEA
ncbi:MAG: hypothetical protein DRI61_05100 [Chloroflexi bacterium]|nr:MAG: hypothetical protein DRI61_05100 [Chloroflexota bacterium]